MDNKILGYFIEEAKEHLETIEQGLLELQAVIDDPERINEMFRAAHSIKGGSAMLGYTSVQKTAHRLEDSFKILKENDLTVDQNVESLFLKGYDVLYGFIEQLQSPDGLNDKEALKVVEEIEPKFVKLQEYLHCLVDGTPPPSLGEDQEVPSAPAIAPPENDTTQQIQAMLQEMLALFQEPETHENRQGLQKFCVQMAKLVKEEENWQTLLKVAHRAISNPKYSFALLAPVVIQEIKQGADLLALEQGADIEASDSLKRLAAAKHPQVLLTVEPKMAARTLLRSFNKKQLNQLMKLLAANS